MVISLLYLVLILIAKSHSQTFSCTSGTVNDVCTVSTDIALTASSTISGSGSLTLSSASLTCSVPECVLTLSFPSGTVRVQAGTLSAQQVSVSASNLVVAPDGVISSLDGTTGRGSGAGVLCNGQGTGGGFGGTGGPSTAGCAGGVPYQTDNLAHPLSLGSGGNGGSNSGCSTAGGGIVFLNIGNVITINGIISANGQTAMCNVAGGGSGGSVQINASTINCDVCSPALVSANGGLGNGDGGDGGGGRIAIKYTTLANSVTFQALGGFGKYPGGAGTVYDLVTNTLIFDGGQATSALPPSQGKIPSFAKNVIARNFAMVGITASATYTLDSVTLSANSKLYCDYSCSGCTCDTLTLTLARNISVSADSLLFCQNSLTLNAASSSSPQAIISGTVKANRITITLSSMIVGSGAYINADGGGSNSGSGPGAGASCPGGYGGGAGYGGAGGNSGSQCPAGAAYGSQSTAPSQPGSGGGDSSLSGGGGKGGGLILITVPSFTLEGIVTANGADGQNNGGGGSGGGVSIVGSVTCSQCARPQALVIANGGKGFSGNGGGGGGGRIYFSGIITNGIDVQTLPGDGAGTAQGGTVYLLCPNGQYPTGLQCNPCSTGQFGTSNQCFPCNAGTYTNQTARTVCTSCTAGTFNNKQSSTSCTTCLAGTYARTSGLTLCSNCNAGTYSLQAASTCINCDPGYYQSVNASSYCNNCTAGKFAPTASTACFSCDHNHYSGDLAGSCTKCKFGNSANDDQTACKLAAWVLNVTITIGVVIAVILLGVWYYKRYRRKQLEEKLMDAAYAEERATPSLLPWRSVDDEETIGGKFREMDDDDDTASLKRKAKNVVADDDDASGSTDVIEAFNQKYGSTTKGGKSSYSSKSSTTKATPKSTSTSKTSTTSSSTSTTSRASSLKESIFGQDKPNSKSYKSKGTSSVRKKQEQRKRDARSALLGRGGGDDEV